MLSRAHSPMSMEQPMIDDDEKRRDEVAWLRFEAITGLLRFPPGVRGARALSRRSSALVFKLGFRPSAMTIRRWVHDYRAGGLAGLRPKPRADTKRPSAHSAKAAGRMLNADDESTMFAKHAFESRRKMRDEKR